MEREVKERLMALKKPLEYAARRDFANLPKIKHLETVVPFLADSLLEAAGQDIMGPVEKLKSNFRGFDSAGEAEKKGKIEDSLNIIDNILTTKSSENRPQPKTKPPSSSVDHAISSNALDTPIQFIKGVGPRIASLLAKKGVATVGDALYLFPHRYDDRRNLRKIAQLTPGETQQVVGDVLATGEVPLARGRKIFEAVIGDGTGTLALKWFHYNKRYMKSLFQEGNRVLASGEVKLFGGAKEIIHPETEKLEKGEDQRDDFKRILPVYPLTEGLGQHLMRRIMARVVDEFASSAIGGIPEKISQVKELVSIGEALKHVHLPDNKSDITELNESRSKAHKSLVYDEFFFLELGIAMRSHGLEVEEGVSVEFKGDLKSKLLHMLPFELTKAQVRVIGEIEGDIKAGHPMHRLLQGDVGCGKTMVALVAALNTVEGGCQAAIMAPTEILAEQHYINIHRFAERLNLKTELIKGSLKGKEKREIAERIRSGAVDIVIGTHALIQEGVEFHRLGLGIIDEQHRFGVAQRARLKSMGPRGVTPNILVMTATPIPRSLAMTVYGDLDLSVIDELPPGRQPIETKVYHERERERVYRLISGELKKGRQAYIVYPLVEESEKSELMDATGMAKELQDAFDGFSVGLIHGRMKVEEKEAVMSKFKGGNIDILVATTVIEVGIDVPNATVMVIEHAERFGLSQLHQLRGRVGRGSGKSVCILLAQYQKSDEARERLRVIERHSSGFDISEADLKLRGPGDFLGTRQSGMPDFRIGNILKDERILKEAREDAFAIIERDPELKRPEHRLMKEVLKERWRGRLELAGVG